MSEGKSPPYSGPAGGWGALGASLRALVDKGAVLRGSKALMRMNQNAGFDCPGCAWPEPEHRSSFEFCENGVKAAASETTARKIGPDFFARHTVTQLRAESDQWLEAQGRLTHPCRYDPDTDAYQEASWEEAFAAIGGAIAALDDPNRAVFYTSGRTSNEAAFLYQLMARASGTNNLPDCANMCHESSGKALGEVIGIGKGTVTLDDFSQADLIMVWGQNPGTNHPRMLTTLQEAAKRGATIVSVNPLRERGLERFLHPQHIGAMLTGSATPISGHYLQPLVGGDMALIKGMIKRVLQVEAESPGSVLDLEFLGDHTSGLDAVAEDAHGTSWAFIVAQTGLSQSEIETVADLFIGAERVITCWAMGLTQHKHSVPTLQTLVNLMLLRGQVGKPGAGFCPVRGHSNVQGDRTMGITPWPKPAFLDALDQTFGIQTAREHGVDVVGAIEQMRAGQVDVFVALGGNFYSATPDTALMERALQGCKMTVQISTKLNRSHLIHGEDAWILPCLSRSEEDETGGKVQRVSVEDSMSWVHASQGRLSPAAETLLSEPEIVARLGMAILPDSPIPWADFVTDYDRIRDRIAQVLPAFEGYNQRLDEARGFYLGNSAARREWNTQGGKALMKVHPVPDLSLPEGQLRLMTLRSHDQYNTTIYGSDDRYRGVKGERRVVFMNAVDLDTRGLEDGQRVTLVSCFEDGERRAEDFQVRSYDIPVGCAGAYFPEANVLVSIKSFADVSRTPTSKFIPIRIEVAPR